MLDPSFFEKPYSWFAEKYSCVDTEIDTVGIVFWELGIFLTDTRTNLYIDKRKNGQEYWYQVIQHDLQDYPYLMPHRIDGPAKINYNSEGQWIINGDKIDTKIRQWAKEQNINLDNLSENDKVLIKLTWDNT